MSGLFDEEVASAALCWRLERADGAGVALTSHDAEFEREGVLYRPEPGMSPAAVTRRVGLDAQSAEVAGALSSDTLNGVDLSLGRWDGARVSLAAFDWRDEGVARVALIGGEIGGLSIDGESFTADLQGAAAKLERAVCPSTSAECRAEFGDKACRVDLAGRVTIATVVSAEDGVLTLDRAVGGEYLLGRLRYMSGANCGLFTVILGVDGSTVSVRDLPRGTVEVGCRVELREGCDKRFETCVQRFANAGNFRGEPHLPGNDLLTRYPGQ